MTPMAYEPILPRLQPGEVDRERRDPVDPAVYEQAARIVEDVRARGADAVREHACRLGDLAPGGDLVLSPAVCKAALGTLRPEDRGALERAAERIESFASAQRASLTPCQVTVGGFEAGHTIAPVDRAGCYAPGGRFPLPSTVLMTAVTARVAGVAEVWVASPRPAPATLAAAAIAGAYGVIAVGGAQAVAAMAFGAGPIPRCDVIAGPGNKWVTAAKKAVVGHAGIDMLAGPSEVLIIADGSADPEVVAADLLAQAEHDPDAAAWVVTTSASLADRIDGCLAGRLADLPGGKAASLALRNGGMVVCGSIEQAIAVSDRLAPEHLEIMTERADSVACRCRHYGAVFIGRGAAEVIGDYGLGPNHTLPTGGSARFGAGLSVLHFVRVRTYIRELGRPDARIYKDAAVLARLEGLEGHARSAEARIHPALGTA
ncbi:MAG: histidinol dehydrogenase [Phycisphaeraceae bacterium]|nr:histidinol dehydrogenase [Phycisphaerae bacterium]MBX3391245.1 histidinol dehydrogenase [Phycisphaeraceae bacterium]